ncbi:hypothetical protein K438DRAFT_1584955 [Mycena galopus ATCC 62051]|nr:hypothetical protein K438DRAFT_1584955 [Mycena galopus ATCC 62051]
MESVTLSPSPEPRRVEKLWFPDGTLVLATDSLLFRIYGGLLAQESPIFDDMLRIPQPKDQETIEGCPVVRLLDNACDVEYFLKALFDYKFFLPFPSPTTFDAVAGIIRLSKKYEVDSLHKRALVHFASGFPPTAAEYPPESPSWDMESQDIHAASLARELSLDWALPVALYRVCANASIDQILNGVHFDNERLELGSADKLLCLEQCIHLRGSASAQMVDFLWEPEKIEGCQSKRCRNERMGQRKVAEGWRNNLLPLGLWVDSDWDDCQVCSTCLTAMKKAHKTSLGKFWDGLPQRFGLGGWDELTKVRSRDLGILHDAGGHKEANTV